MLFNFRHTDKQEKFLESIEGLGDILVSETQKKRRGQVVRKALNDLTDIIIKLFELQKNNPEEFEKLMLDKEFFDIYKKNKKEAALRLGFYPDKYLVAFSSPLNQILRVHDVALKEDDEISRAVVNSLIRVLKHVSTTKKNELFVKQLLRKILEAFHKAIEKEDPSLYPAAFDWYPEIVFDIFEDKKEKDTFNLEYLSLFDPFLISVCKFLIEKNHFEIFKQLILSFIDGVHIPTYNKGKIWDFEGILMRGDFKKYKDFDAKNNFHSKISDLDKVNAINTIEKLKNALGKLDGINRLVLSYKFGRKERSEIKKLYLAYKSYLISLYKYNNLLRIFFGIGAYCWFKKRTNFIKLIWEAKQPPDSDASWGGVDIVPDSISEVLEFYFSNSDIRHIFDFWEGHSGSEKYINEYFLLLLAKYLIPVQPVMHGSQPSNEYYWEATYQLPPKYDSNELSSISYICKKLSDWAKGFKPESNTFEELNLPGNETDVMNTKVSPFLLSISNKAELYLEKFVMETNISGVKVREFKEDFLKGYSNNAVFWSLFDKYSLIKHVEKDKGKIIPLGFNRIEDKEAFIKDWHVHYSNWGERYGEGLASAEDTSISSVIIQASTSLDKSLDDFLKRNLKRNQNKNLIILGQHTAVFDLAHSNQFIPKYRLKKPLGIVGFSGYYKVGKSKIPVIEYFNQDQKYKEDFLLMVDIKKLGRLVQLPPLKGSDKSKDEKLFFEIVSFSENSDAINNFIKSPPPWLKEKGDIQQQTDFLKKKVVIRIQERFIVQLNKNAIYKFRVSS